MTSTLLLTLNTECQEMIDTAISGPVHTPTPVTSYMRTADGALLDNNGTFISQASTNPLYRDFLKWVQDGGVVETPVVSPAQILMRVTDAIQQRLDAWAQARDYGNIGSFAKFRDSQVPRFKADYDTSVAVLDQQWGASLQIKFDVLAGRRPMPTFEEVMAELPPLPEWPAD